MSIPSKTDDRLIKEAFLFGRECGIKYMDGDDSITLRHINDWLADNGVAPFGKAGEIRLRNKKLQGGE